MELKLKIEQLLTTFGGTNYKNFSIEQMNEIISEKLSEIKKGSLEGALATKLIKKCKKKSSKEEILMTLTETMFNLEPHLEKREK